MGEKISDESSPPGSCASSKKKRNSNFTRDEVKCLIAEFGSRSNILNFGTRDQKQKSWEEITHHINRNHPDFDRNVTEIKKKWIDLLYDTKKQYIKATTEAEKNGHSKRRKLSDIAEMIVKIKGGFETKRLKDEMQIINVQLPTEEDEDVKTTYFIPSIEDCNSSNDSADGHNSQSSDVIRFKGTSTPNDVLNSIDHYEAYNEVVPESTTLCSCGLSADFLRLKQEEVGLVKRMIQIEEERRLEEKQKWWETKTLVRLQKQKLELEIKALRQALPNTHT